MIWREVLGDQRFQGGHIETDTGIMRYGGPIARMMMGDTDNQFTFMLDWCAQKDSGGGPACTRRWEICEDPKRLTIAFDYTLSGIPREASDANSFRFKIPGVGSAILLPRGYVGETGVVLKPEMVRGLRMPEPA
jgi:hypothetical protein